MLVSAALPAACGRPPRLCSETGMPRPSAQRLPMYVSTRLRSAGVASRLLRRVVEQPAHLLGVKIRHAPAGSRGAKGPNHIMGVPQYGAAQYRFHGAHADIVPERHSAQEVRPVDAKCLREG